MVFPAESELTAERNGASLLGRVVLVLLTIYAVAMIAPDFLRGRQAREFSLGAQSDNKAIFRYQMHTLPSEIGDRIGTSTLYAAWNAAIYVNQIDDERLDSVVQTGAYLEATQAVLQRYGGLWFNDETLVVSRRRS